MSEPFVFISTHAIEQGKLEATKEWNQDFIAFLAANEPRLIAANTYSNESQTEMSLVLILPDAAAMDDHLRVAHEMIGAGIELAPTISIQAYGTPGPVLRGVLRRNSEAGVEVRVKPLQVGGLTQLVASH
jgi:hypothetical protein